MLSTIRRRRILIAALAARCSPRSDHGRLLARRAAPDRAQRSDRVTHVSFRRECCAWLSTCSR